MKETGILFTAPMVRAIIAGRKTQTRRLAKFVPLDAGLNLDFSGLTVGRYNSAATTGPWVLASRGAGGRWNDRTKPLRCPYGEPGDALWVRETWAVDRELDDVRRAREAIDAGPVPGLDGGPYYRADEVHENTGLRWRPSIFMPRWACRLTLEILSVRVERVRDISEADARAEGVGTCGPGGSCDCDSKRFASLWDVINRKHPWESNPWVWRIEFKNTGDPT